MIYYQEGENKMQNKIRNMNASLIAPLLKVTGYRFSKDYRNGTSLHHKLVYKLINTVMANLKAGL